MGVFVRELNASGFSALEVVQARITTGLILIGVYLLIFDRKSLKIRIKDTWCFVGSGFFYALYSIFGRYAINRGYGAWTITFYTFLFCGIGCTFLTDWNVIFTAVTADKNMMLWILGLGFFTAFLPYVLYSYALENMESSKASILASVEPVVGTLCGVFIFHEPIAVLGVVGIVMVLGAIAILNVNFKKGGKEL